MRGRHSFGHGFDLQVFSFTGFIAMNSVDFYNPKMQVAERVEAC